MTDKNLYDVLGVPSDATPTQVRQAYLLRSKMLHPDRFDQNSQRAEWNLANEMLKELNHAYGLLGDAASRAAYDSAVLRQQKANTPPTKPQATTSNYAAQANTQPRPTRWVDALAARIARVFDRALDRVLSRCESCKSWWSQGEEISRIELGRYAGWTSVMRSQTTYRQDRAPTHTYVTEWQETVPIVRIYYRVTYRCRKCHYTHLSNIEQMYMV